jgi:hypothetical protein
LRLADEAQRVEHLRVAVARGEPGPHVVAGGGDRERAIELQRAAEIMRGAGDAAVGRGGKLRLQVAERRLRRAGHRRVAPADFALRRRGPCALRAQLRDVDFERPEQLQHRDVERGRGHACRHFNPGIGNTQRSIVIMFDDATATDFPATNIHQCDNLSAQQLYWAKTPTK